MLLASPRGLEIVHREDDETLTRLSPVGAMLGCGSTGYSRDTDGPEIAGSGHAEEAPRDLALQSGMQRPRQREARDSYRHGHRSPRRGSKVPAFLHTAMKTS